MKTIVENKVKEKIDAIRNQIEQSIKVKERLKEKYIEKIIAIYEALWDCLKNQGKILLCGNGGSAADAMHIAGELVVRLRSDAQRKALPAIALTLNPSVLTACANDFGYHEVFARQVEALGTKGDCLLGISTSGNSENIVLAIKKAKEKGMFTIAFSGNDGGEIAEIADLSFIVPSPETQRIQEAHMLVGHIICDLIEKQTS